MEISKLGNKVFATENKIGPFNKLKNNIENTDVIPLFKDGLKDIPSDVNTALILGMGGETIFDILTKDVNALKSLNKIIIEPQSSFQLPISYLLNHHFINIGGAYVFERHYYPLLAFKRCDEKIVKEYSEIEKEFGVYPVNNKDPLLKEYLLSLRDELSNYVSKSKKNYDKIIKLDEYLKLWN